MLKGSHNHHLMESLVAAKTKRALRKTVHRGGTKRALLIGINYTGSSNALKGSINDVKMVKALLLSIGYEEKNILTLTDDGQPPTKQNILRYISVCVSNTKAGDTLFFHYSGHGTQVPDKDGDEDDGMDEAIVPLDYVNAGLITDDALKGYLIDPLPQDSNLFITLDCCNSGTGVDLKYNFIPSNKSSQVAQVLLPYQQTVCNCIVLSSCRPYEASSEVSNGVVNHGILTVAFCRTIEDVRERARTLQRESRGDRGNAVEDTISSMITAIGMTFEGLVTAIHNAYIRLGGDQVPQMSSGRYMKPTLTL